VSNTLGSFPDTNRPELHSANRHDSDLYIAGIIRTGATILSLVISISLRGIVERGREGLRNNLFGLHFVGDVSLKVVVNSFLIVIRQPSYFIIDPTF
jgi:hypothetical protein